MARLKFENLKPGMLFGTDSFYTFRRLLIAKKTNEELWVVLYKEEEKFGHTITVDKFKKDNRYLEMITSNFEKKLSDDGYKDMIRLIFD